MNLKMCWSHSSDAREDTNVSQPVLTKPIPCQRGLKMLIKSIPRMRGHKKYLNMCWPNPSHACEDTKYIVTCVDKPITWKPGQRKHLSLGWTNTSHVSEQTICISTCVDQTHPMPARTQNASQNVFNKPLTCQRGHKMSLNMCLPKHPMPLYVWPKPSMPARTQNVSQLVLMNQPVQARTQNISRLVFTNPPHIPPRIQNTFQHVLTKPITCQRGHKMYINMCWPEHSHASEDQTTHLSVRTSNYI